MNIDVAGHISHEMDSLLEFIFSNTNGLLTCYSMYPQK